MANDGNRRHGGGCFGRLMGLLVFLVIIGLGVAMYFVSQPQDLSDLGGYEPPAEAPASPPRDMEAVLGKAVEGSYAVTLSETELNHWLGRRLQGVQGGELGEWVKFKRVWVRLKDEVAEFIVEREIAGHVFTTSMFVQVDQVETNKGIATNISLEGGPFHESVPMPTRGGRLGQLVVPQGFLILVMPEFKKLAEALDAEKLGILRMADIRIEEKRLILDPRAPARNVEQESF